MQKYRNCQNMMNHVDTRPGSETLPQHIQDKVEEFKGLKRTLDDQAIAGKRIKINHRELAFISDENAVSHDERSNNLRIPEHLVPTCGDFRQE